MTDFASTAPVAPGQLIGSSYSRPFTLYYKEPDD